MDDNQYTSSPSNFDALFRTRLCPPPSCNDKSRAFLGVLGGCVNDQVIARITASGQAAMIE